MKQILKPCPFCGSIPEIDTKDWKYFESPFDYIWVVNQRVKITCKECFLTKDILGRRAVDRSTPQKELHAIAKVCAREIIDNFWNRREKA